jgi:hypothetical protein
MVLTIYSKIFQKICTKNRVPVIAGRWISSFITCQNWSGFVGANPEKKYAKIGLRLAYLYPQNPLRCRVVDWAIGSPGTLC